MHAPRWPLLTVIATLGCASGGGAVAARPSEIAASRYAPALGVDVAAMTVTPGGVYVRDLRVGEGKPVARASLVAVRYAGWLADGTPIDSTRAADAPVQFRVGHHDAIVGWEEGVIGMRPGGRRQLVIPPRLGYGARGHGPVPPDAVLVFVIDLVGAR